MSKFFLFTKINFLALFIFSSACAQEITITKESKPYRFFNRIQMGYSFVPDGAYAFERDWKNDQIVSERAKKFSYGKGFNIGYSGGIWLNRNIGVELGFSYLVGGQNEIKNTYKVDTVLYAYHNTQRIGEKVNLFRFGPGMIIQADLEKFAPYGRLNIWYGLGKGKWDIEEDVRYISGGTASGSFKWEVKGVKAFGFSSSFGIKIKSDDGSADYFVEFNYVSMGGTFEKASRTLYSIDGQNLLNTLSVYDKELVYVDEMDYTDQQDSDEPMKVLKTRLPFSSFGINMGLLINLK